MDCMNVILYAENCFRVGIIDVRREIIKERARLVCEARLKRCHVIAVEQSTSPPFLVVQSCVVHTLALVHPRLADTFIPHTHVTKTQCLVLLVSISQQNPAHAERKLSKTFVVHLKAKKCRVGLCVVNFLGVDFIIVNDHAMRMVVGNVQLPVGS